VRLPESPREVVDLLKQAHLLAAGLADPVATSDGASSVDPAAQIAPGASGGPSVLEHGERSARAAEANEVGLVHDHAEAGLRRQLLVEDA